MNSLNKINDIMKALPYCIFGFFIWLVFITVLLVCCYLHILDINSIVEGMKQCIM